MTNRINIMCYLFSIGLLLIIVFLGYYFVDHIPAIVFLFLLFLCCLLLLPGAIYNIQPEQEPTAISWKIFISILVGCVTVFIGLIVCFLKYIGFC